jgi:hypothetical protein
MSEQETINPYEVIVTLPISGSKVTIKTMLTGMDRERIEVSTTKFAKQTSGQSDPIITDIAGMMMAEKHATLDAYIVEIDGSKIECRTRLLKMYEPDILTITELIPELKKVEEEDEEAEKKEEGQVASS